MNFKSQVCTDKIQSERLLSLGLKKETADMWYVWDFVAKDYNGYGIVQDYFIPCEEDIPAWSLHRLIEIVAQTKYPYRVISKELPIYDALCERIEWLIKEGYFPKEYLVC